MSVGGMAGRYCPEGTYTGLYCKGRGVIMSDTPDEIRDHYSAIMEATGHVLINGLGLGVVLQAVARKPEVTKVTVIEISSDVIQLVGFHYQQMFGDKVEIIQADAYEYQPPKGIRYGYVWHDIWDSLCIDNLSEMAKLHRKYGKKAQKQDSWGKAWCLREKRRGSFY